MAVDWTSAGEYADIRYELSGDGIASPVNEGSEVLGD